MSFSWINRVNGVDESDADDVNVLAAGIVANEQDINDLDFNKVNISSIVNNDTTGGAAVPASAEIVKTHGTEIDTLSTSISELTAHPNAKKAVKYYHTDFMACGTNLYNADAAIAQKRIDATTGEEVDSIYQFASGFIPFTAGDSVYIKATDNGGLAIGMIAFYDSKFDIISGFPNPALPLVAPTNTAWMRFSSNTTNGVIGNATVNTSNANYAPFEMALVNVDYAKQSKYDVKKYGAIGNGTNDDTTAIQLALNAANTAGGGTVYFPDGTYLVSTALTVYSNTALKGQSKWNTVLQLAVSSSTQPLLNCSGVSGTPKEHITIEEIHFEHVQGSSGYDNRASGYNVLVFANYVKLMQIKNCVFTDFSLAGIYVSHVNVGAAYWSVLIHDNIFYNSVMQNYTYGVMCDNTGEYVDFSGNQAYNLISAIYLLNSANCRIVNNTICGNQVGIKAESNNININSGKLLITGNTLNHNSGGGINIQIYGNPVNAVSMQMGCNISDNIILLPNNYGIKVTGGWGSIINSNRVLTSAGTDKGIWLLDLDTTNKASYCSIQGNNVMCNAASTTGIIDTTGATGDGNNVTNNILVVRP